MAKQKNKILTRTITGFFYIAFIITAVLLGGYFLKSFFAIITLLVLQEFYAMFRKSAIQPQHILGPILGLLIYASAVIPDVVENGYQSLLATSIFSFILILTAELFRGKKEAVSNVSITLFGILYIVSPLILITIISDKGMAREVNQAFPLLAVFIMIWAFDTFAYLVGRKLGNHKLLERLSPKKSWEGFIGGMVFAIAFGITIAYFLEDQPMVYYGFLGLIISIVGTIGDLIESMIKRSLHLKDSGSILPGHGGLLDRVDSILIVIPVIFVLEIIMF